MRLFLGIVISALATMGLLALLGWWTGRARPDDQRLSQPRRSFVLLIISLVGGVSIGSYWWYRNKKTRHTLQLLFELELLLAQLDGLVKAVQAQGDGTKLLPLFKTVASKIGEYGSKTSRLLTELEELVPGPDYLDLRLGASLIMHGLDDLEHLDFARERDPNYNPLDTIERGVRTARAATRHLIDERISDV